MKTTIITLFTMLAMTANAQQTPTINGVWVCNLFTLTFENGVGKSNEYLDKFNRYDYEKFEFKIENGFSFLESWKAKQTKPCSLLCLYKTYKPKEKCGSIPFRTTKIETYEIVSITDTKMILRTQKATRGPRPEFNYYTLIKQ